MKCQEKKKREAGRNPRAVEASFEHRICAGFFNLKTSARGPVVEEGKLGS